MSRELVAQLEADALACRKNVLRMVAAAGSGHIGGALSCLDMVTALYFHQMTLDPGFPRWPERDRFVLSAGHKCLAQYAALCQRGYFSKALLDTFGRQGTLLPGHPDMRKLPGVEANTGALGHGLSISVGMALGLKGGPQRVYTILGDGELPEGSNWEAAAAAGQYRLDHLCAVVDCNGLQIGGRTRDIMDMEPLGDKFTAFGWAVRSIDGNDMAQIVDTLAALPFQEGKPSAILMKTVKGKGLPALEGRVDSHYWKPSPQDIRDGEAALDSLDTQGRSAI